MISVSAEALHPGPIKSKNKAGRRKPTKSKPVDDQLSKLYGWYRDHGRSLEGAPAAMLMKARQYIASRLDPLEARADDLRGKITTRNEELDRKRGGRKRRGLGPDDPELKAWINSLDSLMPHIRWLSRWRDLTSPARGR